MQAGRDVTGGQYRVYRVEASEMGRGISQQADDD